MRIKLEDLPADRASALRAAVRARGVEEGAIFLAGSRRWLLVMGLLCLALGLISAWVIRSGVPDWPPRPADAFLPWAGLLGLAYGPLALLEFLQVLRAELRPFVLLTPFNLVKSRGSHRPLEIYRLTEARAFQQAEEYHGTTWSGQSFTFDFDGGDKVTFTLRRRDTIAAANRILALAKLAGRGEPLPDHLARRLGDLGPGYIQPTPKPGWFENIIDPASETWLVVLGLLILAFIPYAIFR